MPAEEKETVCICETEVISKIVDFGFNDLGLDEIVAETQTANGASCKLLERVGMTLEAKLHRFGAEQAVYSIKRKESNWLKEDRNDSTTKNSRGLFEL